MFLMVFWCVSEFFLCVERKKYFFLLVREEIFFCWWKKIFFFVGDGRNFVAEEIFLLV